MDLDVCKQFLFVIGIKEFIREINGVMSLASQSHVTEVLCFEFSPLISRSMQLDMFFHR